MNKKQDINKEVEKYLKKKGYSDSEKMAFFDGCVFSLDLNIQKMKGGLS